MRGRKCERETGRDREKHRETERNRERLGETERGGISNNEMSLRLWIFTLDAIFFPVCFDLSANMDVTVRG